MLKERAVPRIIIADIFSSITIGIGPYIQQNFGVQVTGMWMERSNFVVADTNMHNGNTVC